MKAVDVSVVILQKNELLHIRRCLEGLKGLNTRTVFIVDCYSSDDSDKLAAELGANVVYYECPGLLAAQFQWAIENLPIETTWILRLDADEYLTDELIEEIKDKVPQMECDVDGVLLKRRHDVGRFGNCWIKRGMYPAKNLRLFRRSYRRSDMKELDEHIVVQRKVVEFGHDFIDHSLISFEDCKEKHRNYAKRESQSYSEYTSPNEQLFDKTFGLSKVASFLIKVTSIFRRLAKEYPWAVMIEPGNPRK